MRAPERVTVGAWSGVVGQPLPRRELECVLHIAGGQTHKQIARALGVSPSTILKTVERARFRLAVANGAQLVAEAARSGAITIA